jgi:hypothetical protein
MNAILFGLLHAINIIWVGDFKIVFFQVIITGYLGYYIVSMNDIMLGIIIHAMFNFMCMLMPMILVKLFHKSPIITTRRNTYVSYYTLRRSKSLGSFFEPLTIKEFINKNDELQKSFDQFQDKLNKR